MSAHPAAKFKISDHGKIIHALERGLQRALTDYGRSSAKASHIKYIRLHHIFNKAAANHSLFYWFTSWGNPFSIHALAHMWNIFRTKLGLTDVFLKSLLDIPKKRGGGQDLQDCIKSLYVKDIQEPAAQLDKLFDLSNPSQLDALEEADARDFPTSGGGGGGGNRLTKEDVDSWLVGVEWESYDDCFNTDEKTVSFAQPRDRKRMLEWTTGDDQLEERALPQAKRRREKSPKKDDD
ncbi:MAG: hypothetical protein WC763_06465 [Candidatus Paceibacterota bacterium]|jgi:hypothetical protein